MLGTTATNEALTLPKPTPERASHLLILGASGSGKSTLAALAFVEELAAPPPPGQEPLGLLLIDPKGDLVELLLAGLALHCPARLADVRYLDPFSATGFPLNLNRLASEGVPLDIRALRLAELVSTVSTARGAQAHLGMGARQLDVLANLILGALSSSDKRANVLWALDALTTDRGFARLSSMTTSSRAKAFLESTKLSEELRVSSASRLRSAFAATESLERLVSAPGCVQFEDLLAPGRICLIDVGRPIGGMTSLAVFFANLIGRLAIEHLLARPSPWRGHHVRLVCEEAHILAPALSEPAELLLTTGRSRGISLTVVSQGTVLIEEASDTLLPVILGQTPMKIVGRLAARDAELLARDQAPVLGVDETLGKTRANFVAAVTNLADRSFFVLTPGGRQRFTAAHVDVAAWERAAAEHADAIAAVRKHLALPKDLPPRVTLAEAVPTVSKRKGSARPGKPSGSPRSRWG